MNGNSGGKLSGRGGEGVSGNIFGGEADAKRIKSFLKTDNFIKMNYDAVLKKADEYIKSEPQIYMFDKISYNGQYNQEIIDITSFAYLLTEDKKYFLRAKNEMDFVCSLDDWQPFKFLNTSAFALSMAIGYDRLTNKLSGADKMKYTEAIIKKAFEPALAEYENACGKESLEAGEKGWWCLIPWNWNAVCNCGMICAATVWLKDLPELSKKIIDYAISFLKIYLNGLEPLGTWTEGLGYWFYANYYVSRASSMLINAVGTDYGICDGVGFIMSILYAEYMNHDAFNFNFHDTGPESRIDTSPIMYYAGRLNMPRLGASRVKTFKEGFLPIEGGVSTSDLIWYKPEYSKSNGSKYDDILFQGSQECVLRSNDIAIAIHGGNTLANHGHLDCGSCILDALGKRWFCDLGKDMLTYRGDVQFSRWDVYRMRAEGHNCLVINPSCEPDQYLGANAEIKQFLADETQAIVNMDLTECYPEAKKVTREVILNKESRTLYITDTIDLKEEATVFSFFHTRAKIKQYEDKIVLTESDKSIDFSANYPIGVMPAEPLVTSPVVDGQADNIGINKLYIKLGNIRETKIQIKINL